MDSHNALSIGEAQMISKSTFMSHIRVRHAFPGETCNKTAIVYSVRGSEQQACAVSERLPSTLELTALPPTAFSRFSISASTSTCTVGVVVVQRATERL